MFWIFIFVYAFNIQANMAPEGFERFNRNNIFVETGALAGQGIKYALRAGFKEIHSIELNRNFYDVVCKLFRNHKQVHIHYGDSGKILYDVIKDINEPITFWLDGHNGSPDPAGGSNTPLMKELDQIKKHHIKNHIILIDDMHCCGTILFDFLTRDQIADKVREINPEYHIFYVPGGDKAEYPENIMVAMLINHD